MDLSTGTGLLLSLLQIWFHERDQTKQASRGEFLDWLEQHRHHEVKDLLIHNVLLSEGIEKLLQQNQQELLTRLDKIESILLALVSGMDGFRGVWTTSKPELSDQALNLVKWFAACKGKHLLLLEHQQGAILQSELNEAFDIPDVRFLRADLDMLTDLGLLTHDPTSGGTDRYRITRRLVEYAKVISK